MATRGFTPIITALGEAEGRGSSEVRSCLVNVFLPMAALHRAAIPGSSSHCAPPAHKPTAGIFNFDFHPSFLTHLSSLPYQPNSHLQLRPQQLPQHPVALEWPHAVHNLTFIATTRPERSSATEANSRVQFLKDPFTGAKERLFLARCGDQLLMRLKRKDCPTPGGEGCSEM
ncbi:hypothetical protein AAY473_014413 [Plecturocebus cupreus]